MGQRDQSMAHPEWVRKQLLSQPVERRSNGHVWWGLGGGFCLGIFWSSVIGPHGLDLGH